MESVHQPESRPWILPGKIKIREFLSLWAENDVTKELNINQTNFRQTIKDELKVDDDMIAMLELDVSQTNLDNLGDDEGLYVQYEKTVDIPHDVNLETLRLQRMHVEKYNTDRCYRTAANQSLRYRNHMIKVLHPPVDESNIRVVTTPELILTVQLYRPVRSKTHFGNTHRYQFVCDQELHVISSMKLTALRDAITCVSDLASFVDYSETPHLATNASPSDTCKSGFFFINNTFYNDLRHPSSRDNSKVIIDWAKEPGRGIGPFNTSKMEDTLFIDLEIQLGYPYVYQHQGDCEHVLVFSDIRLLKPGSDSADASDYPKVISTNRRMPIRCGFCNLNTSKWIVYENNRLPFNPFFFCDNCFYTFNYDEKSRKIGSFKAYPYLDKSALL